MPVMDPEECIDSVIAHKGEPPPDAASREDVPEKVAAHFDPNPAKNDRK